MSDNYTLTDAERDVNMILQRLERATGQHVRSIDVDSIDVTRVADPRPMLLRTARITLVPIPGSDWQV